jgi:hypothetical protein
MYDLKAVIEANTNEGVIDYEKVMAKLDSEYVNPIIAKKTDKEKLLKDAVTEVVKELGIEGESVDDIKLYVKKMGGSTDEIKEENLRLTKELEDTKKLYDQEVESRTKVENEIKEKTQLDLIKGLGVEDEKQIKFLKWDFQQQVTEDKTFEQVVEEYAKENEITTTAKFVKDTFGAKGDGKSMDIGEAWAAKRKLTRK